MNELTVGKLKRMLLNINPNHIFILKHVSLDINSIQSNMVVRDVLDILNSQDDDLVLWDNKYLKESNKLNISVCGNYVELGYVPIGVTPAASCFDREIHIDGRYRHCNGTIYTVRSLPYLVDSNTEGKARMVQYESSTGENFVIATPDFNSVLADGRQYFEYIGRVKPIDIKEEYKIKLYEAADKKSMEYLDLDELYGGDIEQSGIDEAKAFREGFKYALNLLDKENA